MNWFAIGGGIALIAVGIGGLGQKSGGPGKLSRSTAITLGLVGLVFLILGASPLFER